MRGGVPSPTLPRFRADGRASCTPGAASCSGGVVSQDLSRSCRRFSWLLRKVPKGQEQRVDLFNRILDLVAVEFLV